MAITSATVPRTSHQSSTAMSESPALLAVSVEPVGGAVGVDAPRDDGVEQLGELRVLVDPLAQLALDAVAHHPDDLLPEPSTFLGRPKTREVEVALVRLDGGPERVDPVARLRRGRDDGRPPTGRGRAQPHQLSEVLRRDLGAGQVGLVHAEDVGDLEEARFVNLTLTTE